MPKLKATERFIRDTLVSRIERCYDPAEKLSLKNLKIEFELETVMIRMNLKHLMRRYSVELFEFQEGKKDDALLELQAEEAVAIESLRRLYLRTHEWQTDREGLRYDGG
ncbi:hypothetical protein HNO52_12275 [Billgrantia diversa]|uniref:hypothetical protein n=1 Tax=Halomonas sp. MCCC 1A13316 TaxID=2733487 RepID=UPI0018A61015|nr:hypothetical protein [Halomonas sp. MCCC 1A13316]QOR39204.1 hypothetical protein HNO52_12275 [Halomonas sp. MCCC 1A13316]